MSPKLVQCPKCGQHAVVVDELDQGRLDHDCPDCNCRVTQTGLKCLACGAERVGVSAVELADAQDAVDLFARQFGSPRVFWAEKLNRERQKVARLMEGRW